jgi:hypothetical protein
MGNNSATLSSCAVLSYIGEQMDSLDSMVDDFFCSENIEELSCWSEGEGRGKSNYAIYESEGTYMLQCEHYGFDGTFFTYHFIKFK